MRSLFTVIVGVIPTDDNLYTSVIFDERLVSSHEVSSLPSENYVVELHNFESSVPADVPDVSACSFDGDTSDG